MALKDVLKPKSEQSIANAFEHLLRDFVNTFLPKNFKWRVGQKEAILQIINTYREGKYKVVILDAPVGSGKSLIATTSAYLLNKMQKRGYILASDISLQEQYEKDFKEFTIPWGSVKGIDNYLCSENMEKNSLGVCRIMNKNPKSFSCYSECPYFSNRDKAAASDTALLNYSYWLIMQNYKNDDGSVFSARDFTICDEGHKILDIVQNHFSPRFDKQTIEKLEKLTEFFSTYKLKSHDADFLELKKYIELLKNE
jgi:Rad3-related DNA helicase